MPYMLHGQGHIPLAGGLDTFPITPFFPNLYFQPNTAPSISPAFYSFWTHTGSASRVIGRLNKHTGNSYVNKTIATPTGTYDECFWQVVIPLTDVGIFAVGGYPIDRGIYISFPTAVLAQLPPPAGSGAFGAATAMTARIVDSAGTTVGSADHTLTISATNGSPTITGSFNATDIYRLLLFGGVGAGTLVDLSGSTGTLNIPWSGSTGNHSVTMVDHVWHAARTANNINGGGYGDEDFGGATVYSRIITSSDSLVVELGLGDTSAVSSISQQISLGDPAAALLDGTTGKYVSPPNLSSGGANAVFPMYPAIMTLR